MSALPQVACRSAPWIALLARPPSPLAWLLIAVGNGHRARQGPGQRSVRHRDQLRGMIDVAEED
ncbi:MAG TPA: hypothetical protein VG452_09120 [Egibacteraceae bacterium]|nr:hypothetical protein [Egibacteraceae bacterium]